MHAGRFEIATTLLEDMLHLPKGVAIRWIEPDGNRASFWVTVTGGENSGLPEVGYGELYPDVEVILERVNARFRSLKSDG